MGAAAALLRSRLRCGFSVLARRVGDGRRQADQNSAARGSFARAIGARCEAPLVKTDMDLRHRAHRATGESGLGLGAVSRPETGNFANPAHQFITDESLVPDFDTGVARIGSPL